MEAQVNTHEIAIEGVVTVPDNVDADKFADEFLAFLESKGYSFGGSIGKTTEE
jgi:hypothetical protein